MNRPILPAALLICSLSVGVSWAVAFAGAECLGGRGVLAVASRPEASRCAPVENASELPTEPLILLGELHGTDRSPAAFGALVCRVVRTHGEAVVGLEIPRAEQARIDAYLESEGSLADRRRLLAGEFWTDPYQDGRRSRAMAELLETLRELSANGFDLEIMAFDPLPDIDPAEREEGMARRLSSARSEHPDRPFLVLVGNLHPRTARGTPWDAEFVPMGARLRAAGVEVLPLEIRHAGGSAWICTGSSAADCGPQRIGGSETARRQPRLELFDEPEVATGYAGALWVGEVEASPPAADIGPG